MGEAQHIAVIHRKLKRHQAHAIASRCRAGIGQLKDVLCAWAATQATLRLDQDVGRLGQRVTVLLQINTRTQQRVEFTRAEVCREVNKPCHQFLTAVRV